ncbi:NAD(P)H-binding protein [Phyllobacterium zundukense]|uniref:NAD(P)H-binding protein n=1 Tax=Phyllobacterium zundukense TaxID=1867719 RepID=UPI001F18C284|nr:NAD(P)H-binding protein [Phyllobacterium zundukense]
MITITAATGRYGRLVVDALLGRGVPANEIVAAVRNPAKAADLAAKGVQVSEADYDRPETLKAAFAGADKLLLIPSADFAERYPQMVRAVEAAIDAGVGLVAYASFVNTDTSTLRLGEAHKADRGLHPRFRPALPDAAQRGLYRGLRRRSGRHGLCPEHRHAYRIGGHGEDFRCEP